MSCGLRLIGLVRQGSIPWTLVGLGALSLLVVTSAVIRKVQENCLQERRMPMTNKRTIMFGLSTLDVLWGVGTSSVAGALPA